jgi:hypothetical protein
MRTRQRRNDESTPKQSKFGITVRKLTPEMADRLEMPAGKGVVVQDVKTGSFAEDINLSRGDLILEVNKQPVNSESEFAKIESSLKSGQDVVFLVRPRGVDAAGWNRLSGGDTSVTSDRTQRELALPPFREDDYDAGFRWVCFFCARALRRPSEPNRPRCGSACRSGSRTRMLRYA